MLFLTLFFSFLYPELHKRASQSHCGFSQMFKMLLIQLQFFFCHWGDSIKRAALNCRKPGVSNAFILHISLNSWHYRSSIFNIPHATWEVFITCEFYKDTELAPNTCKPARYIHSLNFASLVQQSILLRIL